MTGLSPSDLQELLHAAATACRPHQPVTGQTSDWMRHYDVMGNGDHWSAGVTEMFAPSALQLQRGECPRLESGLRLSMGCPVLNQLLRGGLPVGGVTELSGESGAGKTQLGLQLCLSVQYPVEHGGLGAGQ